MHYSYNSDFILENNTSFLESDFERSVKLIFCGSNPINEDEEDEVNYLDCYDKRYFITNIGNNFIPNKDDNDKEFLYPKNPFYKSQKLPANIEVKDEHPMINLDENKENDSHPKSIHSKESKIISNEQKETSKFTLTKSLSSTNDFQKITEKKKNLFELDNFKGYNLFHPGGKEPFYESLKNEIQDFEKIYPINHSMLCKFKVKKKNQQITRRKRHKSVKRKLKPDNIRKKIKSRFFKSIRMRMNKMLKEAKSKELFDLLPQCFIINITKKKNQQIMDIPFKTLLTYDFIAEEKNMEQHSNMKSAKDKWNVDIKKYDKNLRVICYLENNKEIAEKSKFDVIGNMTVAQLFDEYLKSAEFEKEVVKLRNEGNDDSYIKDYIVKAFGFINYFH